MPTRTAPVADDRPNSSAGAARRTGASVPVSSDEFTPAGGLLLRVVAALLDGTGGTAFLLRRVRSELRTERHDEERDYLAAVVSALPSDGSRRGPDLDLSAGDSELSDALLTWGAFLERRSRLDEAAVVVGAALELRPRDAELALHAARLSRKRGCVGRARALYHRVRELDGERTRLGRMARVGLALLEDCPEAALDGPLRRAVRAGDDEVAAVAHEERALLRIHEGDRAGALRDLVAADDLFTDPGDRTRVARTMADLHASAGRLRAAREVLAGAEEIARRAEVVRIRARLRDLSRTLGDQVGLQRWRERRAVPVISVRGRKE